ncbi:Hypothetical protein PHPALM_1097 [Phytophthora palmivora]|uniref:EF-hand domain-containing protein n=1 Tax=Phytophthora palmivora TaxID=4796 RepID=A0A2P4YT80_9STRA|nr:Hypothetical protein PHPALM_1097 [Phytophthora palmivora]
MELRRQMLYNEHVGRRNVNELRNVNAMLLEHIISKNPEIKMLEQEIKTKNEIMEALRVDDDDIMATVMAREHDKTGQHYGNRSDPVVSSGLTREDVEEIYHEFDRDKDATLDFDEFVEVMANLYAHKKKPNLRR